MTGKRDTQSEFNEPGSTAFTTSLTSATDVCVKCALCLPHCPTYSLNPTETQSPRGRVSLVAALAAGHLQPEEARASLDSCLSCRACEQVCPARVEYGSILDRGKALMGTASRAERYSAALLRRPRALSVLAAAWRVTRALPLPGALKRWQALPGRPVGAATQETRRAPTGAPVTVLTGCLSGKFDRAAVAACVRLFAAVNRPCVLVSHCCGALDQHSGARLQAAAQAQTLRDAIADDNSPIVHLASGCATAVRDLPHFDGDARTRRISQRVTDPFVLLETLGIHDLLDADDKTVTRVALHLPCTQRNVLGAGGALVRLLASLDDVDAKTIEGHGCCGAAGTHMLRDPATAAKFASRVLRDAPERSAVLLSANIGCAWHLRGALFDRGDPLPVEHPAVFLARRLKV